jgi:hypothetical protein
MMIEESTKAEMRKERERWEVSRVNHRVNWKHFIEKAGFLGKVFQESLYAGRLATKAAVVCWCAKQSLVDVKREIQRERFGCEKSGP